ncbi:MAG: cytochrome P450 [Proteobacteria bacterium]|nr:cytochrome P450 [Pseudomonadota bacterium]
MADLSLADGFKSMGRDAFLAHLHEEAPLYRDPNGFWIASRFEDVRAILLDTERFSSAAMAVGAIGLGFPLLTDDPPRHTMLRALLAKAFTPAAMEAMRPFIDRTAHDLVAQMPAGEEIDAVQAITSPLPVAVIARMMDIPSARIADFARWSGLLAGIATTPMNPEKIQSLMALRACFADIVENRRKQPGDDLVSALIRASENKEVLSDDQVVTFCILLMAAGNETTTNLLGNLLSRLAQRPADWAALRADPALIESAIEESLRIDSPAQMVLRRTMVDVEIGGTTIPKGQQVMAYLASANRDPAKWNDPANFEVARIRERHLSFGHGVHTCIGAPLARIEARAAMTELVGRFSALRPGRERGERIRAGILYGYRSLPLVFG